MTQIISLDQGTTSSRTIIFDEDFSVLALAQQPFPQHYPSVAQQTGWVEHNPEDIWQSQLQTLVGAIGQTESHSQRVLGITNQRETTLLWDRETGEPLHNAIVWQDRRTSDRCNQLKEGGAEEDIQARTGLLLDAYFSATKLEWLLDHVPGARVRAERGELAFGTVDTWLIHKLTRGAVHATDPSNASRTLLFNVHTLDWDDQLLEVFNIPRVVLPEVRPSSAHFGDIAIDGPARGIPICGVIGDQQAATLGQRCLTTGSTKCTFGTGCFMLAHTGGSPVASNNRLLSTVAWQISDEPASFALEGSIFNAGSVIDWLRDGMGCIDSPRDCDRLAASVSDTQGVTFVPAFTGLGAPHWDQHARGAIAGITRATVPAHICRAALNAIACSVVDLVRCIEADLGSRVTELRVDGGLSSSDLLMQIQSDLLGIPVLRPDIKETTALGAAYLAAHGSGARVLEGDVGVAEFKGSTFIPTLPRRDVSRIRESWEEAVSRVKVADSLC